ncbi:MAG: hypothetical protein ACLVD8_25695 [Enterocloster sp.]|uniref:hypothetical protein n=1 Tax=Enterocloster sp. TaxID=2719315 RepID=UPI00399B26C7
MDTTQIRSSRFAGVLLALGGIYVTYSSSAAPGEMALQVRDAGKGSDVERSVSAAPRRAIQCRRCAGVVLGESMELAYQMLTSTGGAKHDYFMLDGSYDHFLFYQRPSGRDAASLAVRLC